MKKEFIIEVDMQRLLNWVQLKKLFTCDEFMQTVNTCSTVHLDTLVLAELAKDHKIYERGAPDVLYYDGLKIETVLMTRKELACKFADLFDKKVTIVYDSRKGKKIQYKATGIVGYMDEMGYRLFFKDNDTELRISPAKLIEIHYDNKIYKLK